MSTTASTQTTGTALQGRTLNLWLALLAFAITFWAWNIVGPLAVQYAAELELDATQQSLLIATPVIVGSLGRIITGALTDRYGGRIMFTILTAVSAVPVLLVMFAGLAQSYVMLIVFGFLLGIAGTTFAIGIPFVNAWYEPSRRGFATGLFGAGMGGTALSSFFTPRMVAWWGYVATHIAIAVALLVVAVLVWIFMRDSPAWKPNRDPVIPKLAAASKLAVTWQMAFLYAVTFGGFVAFSTYLPTYLKEVYSFDLADAGARTAGFAIAAVVARPVGGWLSDKIGPPIVLGISLAGAGIMAIVIAFKPPPELAAGTSFVLMALALGLGTGAVFTWVAQRAPANRVGAVTGIVGAAGGLGGYFPPLVMGATYNAQAHSYTIGLALLCATALGALAFTVFLAIRDNRKRGADTG
ncbi:nitrate/nitrite transporter [Microbacterium immunditiarum]|uniref:NNP family nitrate/nitrite transporter-like MFS transporter n=1 Tax=Microbacterium immunditiarum TaxID=337480 RepID=A0A7Y9GNE1_9MICO|nr:NNP family nitrate/nitrite transporter-like MFS transporter [Microbacterium immunditiarum]